MDRARKRRSPGVLVEIGVCAYQAPRVQLSALACALDAGLGVRCPGMQHARSQSNSTLSFGLSAPLWTLHLFGSKLCER